MDGIIIFPSSDDVSHIIDSQIKIPIVFANYKPEKENCSYVAFNDFEGASSAVEYLIKLGHRNIVFMGGLDGYKRQVVMHEGEIKAMLNAQEATQELVMSYSVGSEEKVQGGIC